MSSEVMVVEGIEISSVCKFIKSNSVAYGIHYSWPTHAILRTYSSKIKENAQKKKKGVGLSVVISVLI